MHIHVWWCTCAHVYKNTHALSRGSSDELHRPPLQTCTGTRVGRTLHTALAPLQLWSHTQTCQDMCAQCQSHGSELGWQGWCSMAGSSTQPQ